ncbi:hypothetical protein VNO77_43792 [Canavalia gladiata]|uniref:Uncharacterized protein n=1 Tax=Canavalia gladiata TaxID=3824 RepID=A0AAN9JUS5_CANGL
MRSLLDDVLEHIINHFAIHKELEVPFNGWVLLHKGSLFRFLYLLLTLLSLVPRVQLHRHELRLLHQPLRLPEVLLLFLLRNGRRHNNNVPWHLDMKSAKPYCMEESFQCPFFLLSSSAMSCVLRNPKFPS